MIRLRLCELAEQYSGLAEERRTKDRAPNRTMQTNGSDGFTLVQFWSALVLVIEGRLKLPGALT